MKLKLVLFVIVWCVLFFALGVYSAKAEEFEYCSGEVNKILVEKSIKKLSLIDSTGCIVKEYNVRVGKNPGPKRCNGDKRTPTGIYHIIEKRQSIYYRFLAIDYPQKQDIQRARKLKCRNGGSIGIHSWRPGLNPEGSLGCITVWTKEEILEIYKLVPVGAEVEIKE